MHAIRLTSVRTLTDVNTMPALVGWWVWFSISCNWSLHCKGEVNSPQECEESMTLDWQVFVVAFVAVTLRIVAYIDVRIVDKLAQTE